MVGCENQCDLSVSDEAIMRAGKPLEGQIASQATRSDTDAKLLRLLGSDRLGIGVFQERVLCY
jgi:hypothetical protein